MRDDLFDKKGNLIGSYESEVGSSGHIIAKKTYDINGRLIEFRRQEDSIDSKLQTTYISDGKGGRIKIKKYISTDEKLRLIFKYLRYLSITIFLISPVIISSVIEQNSLTVTLIMMLSNFVSTVIFSVFLIAFGDITYGALYLGSLESLLENKKHLSTNHIFRVVFFLTILNIYSVIRNHELFYF